MTIIDSQGYRSNVAIVITNTMGQLLWARRCGSLNDWQFPQGGIQTNETPTDAVFRELDEEVGLQKDQVNILASSDKWLYYEFPEDKCSTKYGNHTCRGQKQQWFLVHFSGNDASISLNSYEPPEFDQWMWVTYWYPLRKIVQFKKATYREGLSSLVAAHAELERTYSNQLHSLSKQ